MSKGEEGQDFSFMPFWDHVEELLKKLKSVIYTLIASFIALMVLPGNTSFLNDPLKNYQPIITIILKIVRDQALPPGVELIGFDPTAPLALYMSSSLMLASAITLPVLFYQIYNFCNPALYPGEKKGVYPFLLSFLLLFIIGLVFGYGVLTPRFILGVFPFFPAVGAEEVISVLHFYRLLFMLTVATGVIFTFPVFLILFVKFGIIETESLKKNRLYIYAGLFILTCFITPDGVLIGNTLLFLPMIVLMEAGLFFARRYEPNKEIKRVPWFPPEITCKYCGSRMRDNRTFCPNCGRSQN